MKKTGKGRRLLLHIILDIVVLIAIIAVLVAVNEQSTILSVVGLIGFILSSLIYMLAYDTLSKEGRQTLSFFQKLLIFIGLIIALITGILTYANYMSTVPVDELSPFFTALSALWLMADILTLILYTLNSRRGRELAKLIYPYISLVISYIVFVVLGYVNTSGTIGLVICAVLFIFLLFVMFRLARHASSAGDSVTGNSYTGNSGDTRKQIKDDYKSKDAADVFKSRIFDKLHGTVKYIEVKKYGNTFTVSMDKNFSWEYTKHHCGYGGDDENRVEEAIYKRINDEIEWIKEDVFKIAKELNEEYSDYDGAQIEVKINKQIGN
ncbi:MAG: hypothetical protein LUI60_01165 [Clostridia bacterium]|nr:hypothetical protein [Clostridia bacterium]